MKLTLGPDVIKHLRLYFTNVCNKLVFVLGKPLPPILMFVGKAKSLL
jgi:hypothetical protein